MSNVNQWAGPDHNRWVWFLCLGIALVLGGVLAIMLPAISSIAAGLVLGLVLAAVGILQLVQAFRVTAWTGFVWGLLVGFVQLVGGVLIYLNPLAGAIALTLLIALVFIVQGIAHILLALRLRPQIGWGWLAISGVIALLAGALLAFKMPFSGIYTPGTVTGISLLVAGGAYLAMAASSRRAH
ncbi:HdeD family acid-resistance protein [Rhizobium calliandrae]|uniref:HdeD family acid-resistance protein n=1 Tax=Rhizobium calliandrae TaxID=1312182 RepID=A0ABT7KB89_9HYPH|nr:HdeD family acid-resistance protein [Rhizobium calliandrae]MDL2405879.1 HdeD family acid-resistance protein [Rhizobium calliandrae]